MEKSGKISPLKVIKQDERQWENITDFSKVEYILKEYVQLKDLTIKRFEQRP